MRKKMLVSFVSFLVTLGLCAGVYAASATLRGDREADYLGLEVANFVTTYTWTNTFENFQGVMIGATFAYTNSAARTNVVNVLRGGVTQAVFSVSGTAATFRADDDSGGSFLVLENDVFVITAGSDATTGRVSVVIDPK